MKLEVGMYVRTLNGIVQITEIKDCVMTDTKGYMHYGDFIKASHNIIELIEFGDYVNDLRVEKNKYGELYTSYVYYGGDIGKMCEVYTTWLKEYKEDEIYSIVTKEQFEQMEYKVGK